MLRAVIIIRVISYVVILTPREILRRDFLSTLSKIGERRCPPFVARICVIGIFKTLGLYRQNRISFGSASCPYAHAPYTAI